MADEINAARRRCWQLYYELLTPLAQAGCIQLPTVPEGCVHNAHMFYIKAKDLAERTELIAYLRARGVQAPFHYVPLHSAVAGQRFGRFHGEDKYTTAESSRLLRLPMYYGLAESDVELAAQTVASFYRERRA